MMTSLAAIDLNPTEHIAGRGRYQDSLTSATCAVTYWDDLDKALISLRMSNFCFFPSKYQLLDSTPEPELLFRFYFQAWL
jgi:hypothetical protein